MLAHRCIPSVPIGVIRGFLFVLVLRPANNLFAQAPAPAGLELSDVAVRVLVRQTKEPLQERLPLELHFLTRVCALNDEQAASLEKSGQATVERLGDALALAVRQRKPGQRKRLLLIQGQGVLVPADFNPEAVTMPAKALRRELTRAIHDASPEAWRRCDAEQQRLDARRKRAGALAAVAWLDDALLLSAEQRKELVAELLRITSDAWWESSGRGSVPGPGDRLLSSLAGGNLGSYLLPAVDWQRHLRPVQLTTYQELQGPRFEETIVVQMAAPKPPAPAVPPGAARPQVLLVPLAPGRVIRRGLSLQDQVRRLAAYLEEWVDDVDGACRLSRLQRDKLLLAGKLDIERFTALAALPPVALAEGEEIAVRSVQVPGGQVALPLEIFTDEASFFRKALHGRLQSEQRLGLAAAELDRQTFRREVVVEVVVAGFERASALTSQQCEALATALNEVPALDTFGASADWRLAYAVRLAQLPEGQFQSCFFDFQWPYAQAQYSQLSEAVRQYEREQKGDTVPPPPAPVRRF